MNDFLLGENTVSATADSRMHNETVKKLWNSFTLTTGDIRLKKGDDFTFCIGDAQLPTLPGGKEYALSVTETGIAIVGKDYGGLMRGFMSLLMKIEYADDGLKIKAVTEESRYKTANRMIHICVFPENDLYFIKKLIRLAGLCQYTHIVIEFWGMIRYDCMKELAWPHAFTKEQVKELVAECRELGMEPVPMFNQLGHATASRSCFGKHVVLDQNPRLQKLFTPDGWAWNIHSKEVFSLLKQVREELYEVFGDGQYMHLGCDEADYITRNKELRSALADYLAALTDEVEREGRRPMLWMDMLLEENTFDGCFAVGKKDEVARIRNATAKSTVFVDWQYGCTAVPIPSLVSLRDCGHDVIGAPWCNEKNYAAHIQTVTENGLFGVMLTTWDALKNKISCILDCAKKCGAASFGWSAFRSATEETATLLRRISFEGNAYSDCGWAKKQVEV